MKTTLTLILFLIGTVGIGQSFVGKWGKLTNADKNPTIQSKPCDNSIQTMTFIDSTAYYYQMEQLVNSWTAYKQECWNDSTKLIRWIKPDAGNFAVSYPEYLDTVMVHKQPTFEGFMQYLEKKIKL